jgi:uncharacterized damage-inducible protein DinB
LTNREFCLSRRKAETPTFVRVLKALPQGRLDYRPDPKARTAGELASVLVGEEAALVTLLDTGEILWKEQPAGANIEEMAASFERSAAAVNERIVKMDEAGWQKKARFLLGGDAPAWEDAISEFVWGFLFDQIHHRGQLATYIRPMGGKVPSIYGPSADDPGQ